MHDGSVDLQAWREHPEHPKENVSRHTWIDISPMNIDVLDQYFSTSFARSDSTCYGAVLCLTNHEVLELSR